MVNWLALGFPVSCPFFLRTPNSCPSHCCPGPLTPLNESKYPSCMHSGPVAACSQYPFPWIYFQRNSDLSYETCFGQWGNNILDWKHTCSSAELRTLKQANNPLAPNSLPNIRPENEAIIGHPAAAGTERNPRPEEQLKQPSTYKMTTVVSAIFGVICCTAKVNWDTPAIQSLQIYKTVSITPRAERMGSEA